MPDEITMLQRRFSHFPQRFVWQDCIFDVTAIERCWTISQPQDGIERLCFQVRCDKDRFMLFHDLTSNTWHLEAA